MGKIAKILAFRMVGDKKKGISVAIDRKNYNFCIVSYLRTFLDFEGKLERLYLQNINKTYNNLIRYFFMIKRGEIK